MDIIPLPTLPNSPLESAEQDTPSGELCLRRHRRTGFVENARFDESAITYDESYQNDQSNSPSFLAHMQDMYGLIRDRFPAGAKLVEVGCGKGAFLDIVRADEHFQYQGFDAAYEGDDPAIQSRYLDVSDSIQADVVVLRHTLEHVQRPHEFLGMLAQVFPGDCEVFIEVPQLSWIESNGVIFDFTYEHVNYFDSGALSALFGQVTAAGDCFGGQYQYLLAPFSALNGEPWEDYPQDAAWDGYDFSAFASVFRETASRLEGSRRLWIWGGATKGVLFLCHLQSLCAELFGRVAGVVDINPMKQHRFTPVTRLEIYPPESVFAALEDGDGIVVVNPYYAEEVARLVAESTRRDVTVISL